MEIDVLQVLGGFGVGVLVGILAMLLFNKVRSGSASAAGLKQDYDAYKSQVEEHFEETSKKFQTMTEQYQDLYQHLSVGATSLCRPDSVAAALVDSSDPAKPAQIESDSTVDEPNELDSNGKAETEATDKSEKQNTKSADPQTKKEPMVASEKEKESSATAPEGTDAKVESGKNQTAKQSTNSDGQGSKKQTKE